MNFFQTLENVWALTCDGRSKTREAERAKMDQGRSGYKCWTMCRISWHGIRYNARALRGSLRNQHLSAQLKDLSHASSILCTCEPVKAESSMKPQGPFLFNDNQKGKNRSTKSSSSPSRTNKTRTTTTTAKRTTTTTTTCRTALTAADSSSTLKMWPVQLTQRLPDTARSLHSTRGQHTFQSAESGVGWSSARQAL